MALERGVLLHKRYRILSILGQGGMGSVYHALDENLGVEVAVKENLFTTEEYARQFRLEAGILANLRHPNLPRVTDHFVIEEQGQYLVMDFIEGEDLRQRMERQGSISEEEVILIGAVICDALGYLHTRTASIIHRDVKPGNVKITPEGHIFLVDFGLAKVLKGSQATTTGARAMTPGYSPPEQYGTARTNPRTDIYSLGATLYAALTGVIPEDSLARAMDNIKLTPIRKHNSKVSRRLASIIEKAMMIRSEERYQTAEEFRKALIASHIKTQRLEGEIVIEPPPPLEMKETGKENPRPRKPAATKARKINLNRLVAALNEKKGLSKGFWIFISFLLLTFFIIVLSLMHYWPSASVAFGAPLPSDNQSIGLPGLIKTQTMSNPWLDASIDTNSVEVLNSPLTMTPSMSRYLSPTATRLGGSYGQIAFVSNRTGAPQIFLMNADSRDQHQLTNIPDGACQPDWSPNGKFIVFTSPCLLKKDQYPGSSLYIIKADGTELTGLPTEEGGDFDPAWSPNGTHIVFTSLRDGYPQIYVLNLVDNTSMRLTETASNIETRQPAWSPSGTQIVYTVRRLGVLQIWVMSDTGRGQTQLVRSGYEYWDSMPVWSPDGDTIFFIQSNGNYSLGWLMYIRFSLRKNMVAVSIPCSLYLSDPNISLDSYLLAFESLEDEFNYDIYRMTIDGSERIRLTTDPGLDFNPVWRPSSP